MGLELGALQLKIKELGDEVEKLKSDHIGNNDLSKISSKIKSEINMDKISEKISEIKEQVGKELSEKFNKELIENSVNSLFEKKLSKVEQKVYGLINSNNSSNEIKIKKLEDNQIVLLKKNGEEFLKNIVFEQNALTFLLTMLFSKKIVGKDEINEYGKSLTGFVGERSSFYSKQSEHKAYWDNILKDCLLELAKD